MHVWKYIIVSNWAIKVSSFNNSLLKKGYACVYYLCMYDKEG